MRPLLLALFLVLPGVLSGCLGGTDDGAEPPVSIRTDWRLDGGHGFRVAARDGVDLAGAAFVLHADGAEVARVPRDAWSAGNGSFLVQPGVELRPGVAYAATVQDAGGAAIAERAFAAAPGPAGRFAPAAGAAEYGMRLNLSVKGPSESISLALEGELTGAREAEGLRFLAEGEGLVRGEQEGFTFDGTVHEYRFESVDDKPVDSVLAFSGPWRAETHDAAANGTLEGRTVLLALEPCPAHPDLACKRSLETVALDGDVAMGGFQAQTQSYNATERWSENATGNPVHARFQEWTNTTVFGATDRGYDEAEASWDPESPPEDAGLRFEAAFTLFGGAPATGLRPAPLVAGDLFEQREGATLWTWRVTEVEARSVGGAERAVALLAGEGSGDPMARASAVLVAAGPDEGLLAGLTLTQERGDERHRLEATLRALRPTN